MNERKTIIIRASTVEDLDRGKSHAALIVLRGTEIGRDFRLRKNRMVIGRSPTADIRLPDDGASREHASIDYRGTGTGNETTFVLTDLGSTNRTFVNSERVESVQLRDGDKIHIGDTILKFVVLDSIEASFHAEVRDRISYDQLTGLLTKESLYLAFERELERCLRYALLGISVPLGGKPRVDPTRTAKESPALLAVEGNAALGTCGPRPARARCPSPERTRHGLPTSVAVTVG